MSNNPKKAPLASSAINPAVQKRRKKFRSVGRSILLNFVLILISITMIAPFLWMLSTSLKEPGSIFAFPPEWIPDPMLFSNFAKAWNAVPFDRFFLNSVIKVVCVTTGQLITSSMAAYAFARLRFPGRDYLFFGYLATMMIPAQVTMIPVFILLRQLGWIDTYQGLILPGLFTAYGTFLLRQFFFDHPQGAGRSSRD